MFGMFKKKEQNTEQLKLSFLIKAIKQAEWKNVGKNQKIKISVDVLSCYESNDNKVYAIWKIEGININQTKYLFVCIYKNLLWDDESAGIVFKITPLGNENYESDTKIYTLELNDVANKSAVQASCNYASFNAYTSMPPYILGLT